MALTGYRIDTYMDVNPSSPTFQQTKEERVSDSDCNAASSNWVVITEYCEVDENNANTGWYNVTEMDVEPSSATYGETRESRRMDSAACPPPNTDPEWYLDLTTDLECEEKFFPKSGLSGLTGRLIVTFIDNNEFSPTAGEKKRDTITEEDWTDDMKAEFGEYPCEGVDMEPQVEPISEACETVPDEYGTLVYNGYKNVTGIDKNPYSDTYLETITQRVLDTAKCPAAEDAKFYYRDGMTDELTSRDVRVEWYKRDYTIYVTSSRGSGILPYSIAVPNASWISYDRPTEEALIFTIEKNMNTSERSQTITMTQERTAKECTIRFTQETPPYYFYLDNSSMTAKTVSVGAAATSSTVSITSLWGDEYKEYSVTGVPAWASYTRNSTSKTITFSIQANTNTSSRSATVTLYQQTSGKQCAITLTQAAYTPQPSDYNFLISDASLGNTNWVTSLTLSYTETSSSKYVMVTTDNGFGENVMWGYSYESGSDWINVVKEGNVLRIYPNDNSSTSSRSGRIKLEQDGSNKLCYITVNQSGKTQENENTPEYVQTYGEKFSYGATGNYDFSQLWVMCETYSIEEGFYNAGSETQNSGDVYVLEKFVDAHEYIEFRIYARDPGISGIYFYFGDFNFQYTSESDFQIKTGLGGQVNGKRINIRVTRINEIPMALSEDADIEETE